MSSSPLSKLAETLIPSEIVRLGATIKEKIKQGAEIDNFTIGDFDSHEFPIPDVLKNEIQQAYNEGYTTYPNADGEESLRVQLSKFLAENGGLDYAPDEILISNGGRPLIYSLYRTLVDKGDKVIYPVPSWNNNHYVHFNEGEHLIIEAGVENNFLPTAAQIKPHIKDARLLALCSPLNPTGTAFGREELEEICDLVLEENARRGEDEKKLYVMYDQMYWLLCRPGVVHYNPVALRPEMKKYTISIDGISKIFASTGVRVGWSMGPKEILIKMRGINSHVGSWAPMAEQIGVARFLANDTAVQEYIGDINQKIGERLDTFYKGFQTLKAEGFPVECILPQAAIYLTVCINLTGKKLGDKLLATEKDATEYLLSQAGLAIVPFQCFGSYHYPGWYRLSVGTCTTAQIPKVLERLKLAMQALTD